MRTKGLIWAVLAVALSVSPVRAATPQDMLKSLKTNLYQALAVKALDDTSITAFVMAMPGIPLDPDIKMDSPDDLRAIFTLLNVIPTGDVTGQNSSDKLSDVYVRVLDGHKSLVDNPKKPELEQKAKAIGGQIDALRDSYFAFKGDYLAAQAAANVAYAKKQDNKEVLQNFADQKRAEWEATSKGNRKAYENLVSQLNKLWFEIEGGEPWGARRAKFDTAENQGFPVFSWPKYSSWTNDSGWMKVTASSSDLQKSASTSTVQWGGRAGFFGFGGSAGGTKTVNTSQEQLDKLSISFEVKRVLIDRLWLDASVFRSRKWDWKDPGETPVSYGVFNKQKGLFEGRMPLLPTSLILIRKVVLSSDWGNTTASEIQSGLSAGGSYNFGFFSVGGSYGNSGKSSNSRVQVTAAGIEIPDIQIIGWMCDILPKSPNP